MSDGLVLALSFLFAAAVLGAAEALRRLGWGAEATRKFVHISVGHLTLPLVALVQSRTLALLPPLAFILINYLAWRARLLPGMQGKERPTLGTVYFPASLAALLALFWAPGQRLLVLGAMMLMTWGDGLAAVVGEAWGRHRWRVAGEAKSLEGSLAMLAAGFVSFFLFVGGTGRFWPGLALRAPGASVPLSAAALAGLAALLALVATLLEALSVRGLDNLTIPLGAAAVGLALLRQEPSRWPTLAVGLAAAGFIGWLAWRLRALTVSGALGATLVGGLIFAFGGWLWGLLLIAFFVSSSLLTAYRSRDKLALGEKFAKTGARDAIQALANGGPGAALAVGYAISPSPWLFAAFLGIMATVNADTWATELGSLSRALPRLITTGRRVPRGTSGGITGRGILASAAGALLIAVLAAVGGAWTPTPAFGPLGLLLAVTVGGLTGSLADSLLGASLQVVYRCPVCHTETERQVHRCGAVTERVRGLRLLDNDVVNLLSSAVGGLVALILLA